MVAVSYTVTLNEVTSLLDKMQRMENIKQGLIEAGFYLIDAEREYPPESHRPADTDRWTDKQRKAFFAMLKSGEIVVPYIRSLEQERSIGMQIEDDGFTIRTGTSLASAQFTLGQYQAMYHKITGWRQMGDIASREQGNAYMIVYRRAQEGF